MKGESKSPDGSLKLIAAQPAYCPYADFDHAEDAEMTSHGSPAEPVQVKEKRRRKYVAWEYEFILRRVMYHKCFQQLLKDTDRGRELDRIVVRDYTGKHHVFYFDITEQRAAADKEMKQAYEDYLAGRPVDAETLGFIKRAEKLQQEARKKYPGRG